MRQRPRGCFGVVVDVERPAGDGVQPALPPGRERRRGDAFIPSPVRRGGRGGDAGARVMTWVTSGAIRIPSGPRLRHHPEPQKPALLRENLNRRKVTRQVRPIQRVRAVVPQHPALPLERHLRVDRFVHRSEGRFLSRLAHAVRYTRVDEVRPQRRPQTFHRLRLTERLDVRVPVEVHDGDGGQTRTFRTLSNPSNRLVKMFRE